MKTRNKIITELKNCTTHEELDAVVRRNIELFAEDQKLNKYVEFLRHKIAIKTQSL
jgi:hypothetical protein